MLSEQDLRAMRKLDLNLLIVLHDLIETRSTTATAARLARTQPVISRSLGRLRDFFGDPLLIRRGPTLTPSPLALQLAPALEAHLRGLGNLIATGGAFEPLTASRNLVIAGVDITLGLQMSLMTRLRRRAPNLRVKLDALHATVDAVASGETDLLVALYPQEPPASVTRFDLEAMEWGVLARAHHPIAAEPTLAEWLAYAHIQVSTGANTRSPVTDALNELGARRRIGLQVSLFLQALHAVAVSDMLFTTLVRLADDPVERLGLRRVALPIEIPRVPAAVLVRRAPRDAFSEWLVTSVADCVG